MTSLSLISLNLISGEMLFLDTEKFIEPACANMADKDSGV